jgi:16S rRNA A1518/A1519 N6-dimethyltransferase RsmA/KsgA/DIM1 with predicted DNA glycosylase/AP lyase activity
VTQVLDPEGAHLAALRRLGNFHRRRVLELGCGDGRLTLGIAADAAHVLAFDPDAEAIERMRRARALPPSASPGALKLIAGSPAMRPSRWRHCS